MIDSKYVPYACFDKGILSRLSFKLKYDEEDEEPVMYSIQHGDSSMVENELMTVEQDEIVPYDQADQKYMNGY